MESREVREERRVRTLLDSSDLASAKNLLSLSFLFFSSVSVITIHKASVSVPSCIRAAYMRLKHYDRIYASKK